MTPALYIVIVAMLFQQATSYMAAQVLPSAAPQVAEALNLQVEMVLYHTALFYAVSGIFQANVGGLIIRWGAIRASQLSLLTLGIGLLISMTGELWAFTLAAVIMGAGNSFSTPASSHLLAQHSPAKYAPLIFSIKQTGVPLGGLIAVIAVQLLVDDKQVSTWPNAFMATAAFCFVLMVVLHPMRKRYDADRNPGYPVRISDGPRNIKAAARNPALLNLCLGMFAFVGLQGLFNSIFSTYAQTELGYDKDTALWILMAVNIMAGVARIFWGWIGSSLAPSRIVLAILAFIMAGATAAIGLADSSMPVWMVAAAALTFGASALSWHGLLLSEVARMAPPGQVGPVTGGVLFFGAGGMLSFPFIAKQLLDSGISYQTIFLIAIIPAILIGVKLLFPSKAALAASAATPAAKVVTSTPEPAPVSEPQKRHYRFKSIIEAEALWAPTPFAPATARYQSMQPRRTRRIER